MLDKPSSKPAGRSKSSRCKAAGRRKPERTGRLLEVRGIPGGLRSYVRISDDRARSRWTIFSSPLAVLQHRRHQDDQHAQDQRGFLKRKVFEGFAVAEFFEVEEVER